MYSTKFLCPKRSIAAVTFLYSTCFAVSHAFAAVPKSSAPTITNRDLVNRKRLHLNSPLTVGLNVFNKLHTSFSDYFSSTHLIAPFVSASEKTPSATIAFADQNVNTSSSAQTFTIRGSKLTADVTVSTNPPFTISKDSIVYEQRLTYSVAELETNRTVYVKFKPKVTGSYTDSITNVSEGADNKMVLLTGTAVAANKVTYGSNLAANNIITPNGDGRNDTWVIKNIENYPNNTVKIMDKSGNVIYNKRGYTNDWNGTYGNGPLAQGTYYYIVDFGGDSGLLFRGFITVVRD
jgi:gliding motility-associated-like protein